MTKAHEYRVSPKGYYFIDHVRVSEDRFQDSVIRSERVKSQDRDQGRFVGPARERAVVAEREAPREIAVAVAPKRWVIRGVARPRSDTDARTDKLVTDHFIETNEHIGNIDQQEEMLNEKYDDWVHFDTYIEESE